MDKWNVWGSRKTRIFMSVALIKFIWWIYLNCVIFKENWSELILSSKYFTWDIIQLHLCWFLFVSMFTLKYSAYGRKCIFTDIIIILFLFLVGTWWIFLFNIFFLFSAIIPAMQIYLCAFITRNNFWILIPVVFQYIFIGLIHKTDFIYPLLLNPPNC